MELALRRSKQPRGRTLVGSGRIEVENVDVYVNIYPCLYTIGSTRSTHFIIMCPGPNSLQEERPFCQPNNTVVCNLVTRFGTGPNLCPRELKEDLETDRGGPGE